MSETDFRRAFSEVLHGYLRTRANEPYGSESAMYRAFVELRKGFETVSPIKEMHSLLVRASAGQGNWAKVPWIGFLDGRETKSTMRGVYCAYLFKQDMTGFYLTLTQGISEPTQRLGTTAGMTFLREKSEHIRSVVPRLLDPGFFSSEVDLVDEARLNALYKAATVASRLYGRDAIPETNVLLQHLRTLLDAYDRYISSSRFVPSS